MYTESPSIYVYDMYPGGTGLSEALLTNIDKIFPACFDLVNECSCSAGCPSCIGPELEDRASEDDRKKAVLSFLSDLCRADADAVGVSDTTDLVDGEHAG
jgi:DEAD/DEAH box helicase domain-containing protein